MDDNHADLKQFIEVHADDLHRIVRHYVQRAGLASPDQAGQMAADLVNDVVIEALNHADRLRARDNPMLWLLGIAANLIKRRQTTVAKLERREPLLRDLYPADYLTDDEVIDRVAGLVSSGQRDPDSGSDLQTIMAHLPQDEAHLLQLAVLHDLDGEALGQAFGITPGAARVRLHRALKRLRQFWGSKERIYNHE